MLLMFLDFQQLKKSLNITYAYSQQAEFMLVVRLASENVLS